MALSPVDRIRFSENASRAVFVTREVSDDLIGDLAPQIVALRQSGTEPICVYIDSAGGSVFYAQRLLSLLTSARQDGHIPWIISICIGFAASAAADLLALGDYAIAYPFSVIHHHGTRQNEQSVTVENIGKIESSLRETNEDFAIRLATKIFHRLIVRILQIRTEASPNFLFHETIADPQSFISTLRGKLTERHRRIIDDAAKRQRDVAEILKIAGIKPETTTQPPESQILKAIIDFEGSKTGSTNKEFFSASELSAIHDNLYQIRGLFHERYSINLIDIVHRRGVFFLQPDEQKEYDKIPAQQEQERSGFLMGRVAHKLNPIWWLVVSLSRCLQTGEHTINPIDAYWLGLVDEVIGSDLPSLRQFVAIAAQQQQQQQPKES
jgi:ATP-dependent protease ClpP protease subunit